MERASRNTAYTAIVLMAVFTALGALFIAGYAFDDPGGWTAAAMVALWLAPLVLLAALSYLRPAGSAWLLGVLLVVAGLLWGSDAVDITWWQEVLHTIEPALAIATFVLALPIALLGLSRPGTAGIMLIILAALPHLSALLADDRPWPGLLPAMTTPSTMPSWPALVIGLMLLLAGLLGHLGRRNLPV